MQSNIHTSFLKNVDKQRDKFLQWNAHPSTSAMLNSFVLVLHTPHYEIRLSKQWLKLCGTNLFKLIEISGVTNFKIRILLMLFLFYTAIQSLDTCKRGNAHLLQSFQARNYRRVLFRVPGYTNWHLGFIRP